MIPRRRFLLITAATAAMPAAASAQMRWTGRALGAEVMMELSGDADRLTVARDAALATIRRVERLFSLYDPGSDLSRLNATGRLDVPPPDFLALVQLAGQVHEATGGLFDPTVQPLWAALAHGHPTADARAAIGWSRVRVDAASIRLAPGQSLTFNGIAQGFATDLAMRALKAAGLRDIHVDIGEHAAQGRPRRLGLADPTQGTIGTLTLKDAAVATSSPGATRLGRHGHILSPLGHAPLWSTVSVMADSAALADGLSTALCLAPRALAARCRALPGIRRILLVDAAGDLVTL